MYLPDEDDLAEAEVAVSATPPEDLKRDDRRVSRPPDPEAPEATPPEAAPKPVEEVLPVLRLLVLLPQDS